MKLKITQEEIDASRAAIAEGGMPSRNCPVSRAAERMFGYPVAVGFNSMFLLEKDTEYQWDSEDVRASYKLSEELSQFIRNFDLRNEATPGEYEFE